MSFLSHRDTHSPPLHITQPQASTHCHIVFVTLQILPLSVEKKLTQLLEEPTTPTPNHLPLTQDRFFFGTCSRVPLAKQPRKLCDSQECGQLLELSHTLPDLRMM